MNRGSSGGGYGAGGIIGFIIALAVRGGGLFAARRWVPALFPVMLWIIIGLLVLFIGLIVLLVVLAVKSGKKNPTDVGAKLNEEQSEELKEARAGLMNIRRVNMRIHVMDVRNGANQVCASLDKILLALKEKPEKIRDMRQCLNYYIPTLHDVLGNFRDLEAKGQTTPEMQEKATRFLGDVKVALDNKYDSLFNDDKLDMEVDMDAMTLALKRDGLL